MTKVAIMLGGNLPGTAAAMRSALDFMAANGLNITAVSSDHVSTAVDCLPDTPDFIDRAVTARWDKSPAELLELCQKTEQRAGRPAIHRSCESRILDCDIIIFGSSIIDLPRLKIPHPRAQERFFVLEPLAQIASEWIFPDTGKSVAAALDELEKR